MTRRLEAVNRVAAAADLRYAWLDTHRGILAEQ
jgi:hypothetical protein